MDLLLNLRQKLSSVHVREFWRTIAPGHLLNESCARLIIGHDPIRQLCRRYAVKDEGNQFFDREVDGPVANAHVREMLAGISLDVILALRRYLTVFPNRDVKVVQRMNRAFAA